MSEYTSELKEPLLMAGVADAAADENRAEGGLRQQASGTIRGKLGHAGKRVTVHLGDFEIAGQIYLAAYERRKCKDFVEVARPYEEILVSLQFVEAIGAEAAHTAQKKLWHTGLILAESSATLGHQIDGTSFGHRLEVLGQQRQRRKSLRRTRVGI